MSDIIFNKDFYSKLEKLSLIYSNYVRNGMDGMRKSKTNGNSVEFSDYREYNPGDDYKKIDWNAYGRFEKLFIKLFMEERQSLVNIFIDSSESMNYGSIKKSTTAIRIAAMIAYITACTMDRVWVNSLYHNNINISPPISSKPSFYKCIGFLEDLKFEGRTNLNQILKVKFKDNGITIIISDFLHKDCINDLSKVLKHLVSKGQKIIVFHLLSSEEMLPVLEGNLRLIDSETGKDNSLNVTPFVLMRYNEHLQKYLSDICDICSSNGSEYIFVRSDENLLKLLSEKLVKAQLIKGR